jgi:hypothetical protein
MRLLLAVSLLFIQSAHASVPCTQQASINVPKEGDVRPVQLLALHNAGTDIVNDNFQGLGMCFYAERSLVNTEQRDFELEETAYGRGAGRFAYLLKEANKHVVLFMDSNRYAIPETHCQAQLENDRELARYFLTAAPVNEYDPMKKVYYYHLPGHSFAIESREIRSVADGMGITLHLASENRLTNVICYFSKR